MPFQFLWTLGFFGHEDGLFLPVLLFGQQGDILEFEEGEVVGGGESPQAG